MRFTSKSVLFGLMCLLGAGGVEGASIQPAVLPARLQQGLSQATQISQEPPIYVHSQTVGDFLGADVYAVLDAPYEQVRDNMTGVEHWCAFVAINLNIKACVYHPAQGQVDAHLDVYAGRKFYQAPEDAYLLQYRFQVQADDPQLLDVLLDAKTGPLGTRNYTIHLQAMPYEGKTLVHMSTGYEQSLVSSMATRAYLNTLGRDKVGFSIVSYQDHQPVYNDGIPAVIERNAMRYYLALDAYLHTLSLPEAERHEASLRYWYEQTMRYQAQLYELDQAEYLASKQQEYLNQTRLQAQVRS